MLCANENDASDRVKSLMGDFSDLKNAPRSEIYDHHGRRNFETIADAKARREEIFAKAGSDVLGIDLAVG